MNISFFLLDLKPLLADQAAPDNGHLDEDFNNNKTIDG